MKNHCYGRSSSSAPFCRSFLYTLSLLLVAINPVFAVTNSWTKSTSGFWEEQPFWSLGVLPNSTQDIVFSNPNWKALAIGANTAQNFPQSMRVKSLSVGAPVDTFNTLLMSFAGYERPLQTDSLIVESNCAFVMHASLLEVAETTTDGSTGNLLLNGTFRQGDFSGVKVHRNLIVRSGGSYFMTNGTLAALHVGIGNFAPGQFSQYGGFNNLGSLQVSTAGEFDLYGGELTASNGIVVGSGDFARTSSFRQHGGSIEANTTINGNYVLNGGIIIGRMSVPGNTLQRVNGSVLQTGGTNLADAMDLGFPNRFGGAAIYDLSNGVVRVASSTMFHGGWFSQYNGQHTIATNFLMEGRFVGPGNVYAEYVLAGGTLSVGSELAVLGRSVFRQGGGSNRVARQLLVSGSPPDPFSPPAAAGRYTLAGGYLSAHTLIMNPVPDGSFLQTGGSNLITERIILEAGVDGTLGYTLEGGTLAVKDIKVGNLTLFKHTGGIIVHSGMLILNHGNWQAANGEQALGPLLMEVGHSSNSSLTVPDGSSILRLANSSGQTWHSNAVLYITNWHGSISGGGQTRLYFGSTANGLTAQQLAQIKFSLPGGLSSARILATGEVVPQMQAQQQLGFSRSGNTITLRWEPTWILQSSTNVAGPYQDVNGASSPYTPTNFPIQFFRLRL